MNEYRITYQSPDGESATRTVIERTEKSATKAFRAVYKESGDPAPDIFNIELIRTDALATKQQERDTLAAIRQMVEELGPQSYLATAFQGCFEIAEQNIEYDFGDSMKGRAEVAERKSENLETQVKELEEKLRQEIADKQRARDEAQSVIKKLEAKSLSDEDPESIITILGDRAEEAEELAKKTADEIVRLADDPASPEFRRAVSMNRNHSVHAKSVRELIDRVAAVRAAAHTKG